MRKLSPKGILAVVMDSRPLVEIAEAFGIPTAEVSAIKKQYIGEAATTAAPRKQVPRSGAGGTRFTEAEIHLIRMDTRKTTEIAKEYGRDPSWITQIQLGKAYRRIPWKRAPHLPMEESDLFE